MGRAAANGALWSSVGRIGNQALQFLASLVLARILLPEDFGLLASVLVFIAFAELFFDMGMGQALVQRRDLRADDINTVFWLNALGGLAFAGLAAACGPLIADFFGDDRLALLAPVASLTFTANIAVCQLALLQRQMRFRAIAITEIAAALVGYGSAIVMAVQGLGVYALALGPVVVMLTRSAIFWTLHSWRPTGWVTRSSVRRIWGFSGGLLGSNLAYFVDRTADNLLIGKFAVPPRLATTAGPTT